MTEQEIGQFNDFEWIRYYTQVKMYNTYIRKRGKAGCE